MATNSAFILDKTKLYLAGIINSYSQVFFSNNKVFAFILLLISFFDVGAGVSGIIAIVICQITATFFHFNLESIRDGAYTYNALMVGMAIGIFYEFNASFFVLLIVSSLLTFFLTLWFSVSLARKGLPFLSLPFLIMIWIIILGANNFSALELNQKETLSLAVYFPELFTATTRLIEDLPFSNALYLYFRSLGAIFFQFNDLSGILICIGLLYFSRISFLLSIYGFLIGYLFYYALEGDFSQLIYSYIGFNFILTGIALGGFFIIPSRRSFLLLLITIPIIALLLSALHTLFGYFNLPLYSLPFNIVVLLVIAALQVRWKASGINLVTLQQFSPEKNHYKFFNAADRFKKDTYFHISLPVMGNWYITQGYNGGITHKDDWQHALDFNVVDEEEQTYQYPGTTLRDYYCYDLPVVAVANGTVVEVLDGIDDNKIGEVNLEQNWGNTVVIKHGDYFYSKLTHFKQNTIQVKVGDYIEKGDVLGYCGSSGRSPEPHLHFQLQATPDIGSKTLEYPISYYLTKQKNGTYAFHQFDIPKEKETVRNITKTKLLTNTFKFLPGKNIEFEVLENRKTTTVKWEVFVTALNQTYIYCKATKSSAYFVNNGTLFYFTDFYGDKNSFLHYFYLGFHKVLLGYYSAIKITDKILIDSLFSKPIKALHDLTAPFFHYCAVDYQLNFVSVDDEHNPDEIKMKSNCVAKIVSSIHRTIEFETTIKKDCIAISIIDGNKKIEATCLKK